MILDFLMLICLHGCSAFRVVSRLSVGGGYGWLSGAHGLVIDNFVQVGVLLTSLPVKHAQGLEQVTVVTADGSVLIANDTENTDLYWGVRGGGSNFGVVTQFVFRLHPQRTTVFAGRLVFTPDKCEQVAAFLDEWWPRAKSDEAMLVNLALLQGKVSVQLVSENGNADACVYKAYSSCRTFLERV